MAMNSNFNKKNVIIIVFAVIVFGLLFYMLYEKDKNTYKPEYDTDARIVKNNSDFYTISSCINKFVNYVNKKDTDAVVSLLTNNYKESNKINNQNVLSTLDFEENSIFVTKKILYKFVDEGKYKYYVYGVQGTNNTTFNSDFNEKEAKDKYYIVYTVENSEKSIFSIEPYDGKEFLGD